MREEWPQVDNFAEEMKTKLTFCRDVKGKTGWFFEKRESTLRMLDTISYDLMLSEFKELLHEISHLFRTADNGGIPADVKQRVMNEAVDVGALAMMIFDIAKNIDKE